MSIFFLLPLTKGYFAKVDFQAYLEQHVYKWTLKETKHKKYAYRQCMCDGKLIQILLHRAITNCPVGMPVDHKNGDGLDNTKANLRVCTQSQNLANTSCHVDRKYKLPKGVGYKPHRIAKPYYAQITIDYKKHFLGAFASVEEADRVYQAKAKELFGDFAR